MARARRRRPRTRTTEETEEVVPIVPSSSDDLLEALFAKVKEGLDSEQIYSVQTQMMVSVKKQNGEWRNKPIDATEELTFLHLRRGARKQFLFGFKPMNPEYALVEIPHDTVFQSLKGNFEKDVVEALGFKYENVQTNADGEAIEFNISFHQAVEKFLTVEKDRRQRAAEEAEKLREAEATKRSEDNPLWGAF